MYPPAPALPDLQAASAAGKRVPPQAMALTEQGKLARAPDDFDKAVTYGAAPSFTLPVALEGLEHPYNWSTRRKWLITLQAALLIFSSTITSSAPSGGSVVFQQEYGIISTVAELLVSVFLIGYVVGPFITAPSTEAYGRRWPSIACMALYTIFNGACAGCSSITPLLICRFFAGMWASGPISTSASIVTDIWVPRDRNLVMSIWSIGSFSGPALGPVVGGFISVSGLPTRWIFIVMTILTGAMTLFIACCLPETYEPELIKRKTAKLQEEAGISRTLSQTSRKSQGREHLWRTLKTLLTRPFILFVHEPLLILSTLYSSFAYAVLYLLFPLYPIIFREIHGIQPGLADLPFVAILIGVVSAISVTYLYQRKYVRDLKRAGGKHTPELRLPPAFAGGPVMLVALLWLGWTGNTARISPYAPAFSGVLTGLASVLIFRSFSSYVIECYKAYGASAMATLVIWRSVFAAGLPLAVAPMVRSLGVGWTATLLAGFQATLIPIPFLFYRYGPVIRQRSKYSQDD